MEFVQLGQVLAAYTPPDFPDEFFESIRSGVLKGINKSRWTSFVPDFRFLNSPFYAACAALLICAIGGLLYLVGTNDREKPQAVATRGAVPASPVTSAAEGSTEPESHDNRFSGRVNARRKHALLSDAPRTHRAVAYERQASAGGLNIGVKFQEQAKTTRASGPATPSGNDLLASNAANVPVRLELQTSDPNIRIIWFTSPERADDRFRRQ